MSFTLLYSLFFLHRLLMVQAVLHARLALQSPWQYSDSSHEFHTVVSTHSKLSIYLDLAIEGLGAGGEGDDRRWDGWMASPTRCTWVWVNSWSWWWTGRPGVLWFLGSDTTEWLNWTELIPCPIQANVSIIEFHIEFFVYPPQKSFMPCGPFIVSSTMSIHHTQQQPWVYPSLLPLCECRSLKLIFLSL